LKNFRWRILIYFDGDEEVKKIALFSQHQVYQENPYKVHGYFQNKTGFYAATHNRVVPVKNFGEHNMQNLSAARKFVWLQEFPKMIFMKQSKALKAQREDCRKLQKMKKDWFISILHIHRQR
jgi:hypothetical protein